MKKLTSAEDAIEQAIEGLIAFPKRATIKVWYGIKVSGLRLYGVVKRVVDRIRGYSNQENMASTYAISTITTLQPMDVFLAIKKLEKNLEHLNLSGLANDLGITKEGVMRLIWLCADARNINNGSEPFSSEMISLVKNAVLRERILKLTTIPLDSQRLWMKKESEPTKMQWRVNGYGIQKMGAHYVGSATAI